MSEKRDEKQTVAPEAPDTGKDQAATVTPQAGSTEAAAKKAKKPTFSSPKYKHGGMAILLTAVFVAVVIVANILFSILADRYPSINVDLSANKINSLSEESLEVAKGAPLETEIIVMGDEEEIRKDQLSSAYKLSQVANLGDRMSEVNRKISITFIDPDKNPTFVSAYPEETLTTGSVMVRTEKRHRVLGMSDMFANQTNQTTGQTEYYSKIDSALANAIDYVNQDTVPLVAIATGHQELLASSDRAAFDTQLQQQGYDVREFNILTDEIPDDASIVMLPTPTTDYTKEEIDKLRIFLDVDIEQSRTLLLTCHYSQGDLPMLSSFLEEWGVRVEPGLVAETDSSRILLNMPEAIMAKSAGEVLSDNVYSLLVSMQTSPLTVLFEHNDDTSVSVIWESGDTAVQVTEGDESLDALPQGEYALATYSTKFKNISGVNMSKNVVVFGSTYAFLDSFIGNTTFSNRQYVTDLLDGFTGVQSSTIYIEDIQTNVIDVTTSAQTLNTMLLVVCTLVVPLAILAAGLIVFLRRRHL